MMKKLVLLTLTLNTGSAFANTISGCEATKAFTEIASLQKYYRGSREVDGKYQRCYLVGVAQGACGYKLAVLDKGKNVLTSTSINQNTRVKLGADRTKDGPVEIYSYTDSVSGAATRMTVATQGAYGYDVTITAGGRSVNCAMLDE